MTALQYLCPSCHAAELSVFYLMERAPVHSVLLLPTREEALSYPTGTIALGFCPHCGFISNVAFDASLHEYSARYEETQGFSPTFNAFHRKLAHHLIERYDLRGKRIIEIGSGKGEFLTLLCEMGGNRGVGFDPAYVSGRIQTDADVTFIKDFYAEQYAHYQGDFVCCKMTLEHIPDTADFLRTIYRSVAGNKDVIVFFQVPNARYIFSDVAFWDIYYEHCSYFSQGSMARLFRHVGFKVLDLWTDYNDQYLMIEARPANGHLSSPFPQEETVDHLAQAVAHFADDYRQVLGHWRKEIQTMNQKGQRIVLWGGGSKGVAFLTTLKLGLDDVKYVVDINPHKTGTYMAGTGQEIVAPEFLKSYRPDVVIVMNPIYHDEIKQDLAQIGLSPRLITV